jgi:CRISPR-associated exonuclease Cas4
MYPEDDLLPLSALQHFSFCPRQCALIHIEQVWVENRFTAEGRVMHENVHEQGMENRKDVRIERGIPLRSLVLGLIGKADLVEFHKRGKTWLPFPVEYKRGKPKPEVCDKVQLCAQAICLEEMLDVQIPDGALFYGKTHHRLEVAFDEELRRETAQISGQLHAFIALGKTPLPVYEKKCETCSFIEMCMPETLMRHTSIDNYINEVLKDNEKNFQ